MKPQNRKTVRTIAPHAVNNFAVFRHSGDSGRAHFQVIHSERDTAESEAVRLLTETIGTMGADFNQAFYVVEIKTVYRYTDKKFAQDTPAKPETNIRSPLTDDEVVSLFNKLCKDRHAYPETRYRDFARLVEAAHGIK